MPDSRHAGGIAANDVRLLAIAAETEGSVRIPVRTPPPPSYYAIELAARLIVLQLLTDAIAALEHP